MIFRNDMIHQVKYSAQMSAMQTFCRSSAHSPPAAGDVGEGTPEPLHYLHDALGSVAALTDASGSVVESYAYDPYGPTYIEDPLTGDRREASLYDNPFAWTGQRYDAGVRLYHFPQRTHSPRLGRWLQRDPLGYVDGVNLYEYARSMPTFFVDPFGLAVSLDPDPGSQGDVAGGNQQPVTPATSIVHVQSEKAGLQALPRKPGARDGIGITAPTFRLLYMPIVRACWPFPPYRNGVRQRRQPELRGWRIEWLRLPRPFRPRAGPAL